MYTLLISVSNTLSTSLNPSLINVPLTEITQALAAAADISVVFISSRCVFVTRTLNETSFSIWSVTKIVALPLLFPVTFPCGVTEAIAMLLDL
jgi:hypothetical protein